MTKKEQIDGIAKYVCNACEFGIYRACSERRTDVKSCSLALGTARRIYNAGYRKTPNDIREMIDVLYEGATLKEKLDEIKQLKNENKELKAKLEARLTCDLVKTAQKQAVQEFAEKLKEECCKVKGYEYSFANIAYLINQLLKEYE